jgi:hypothetical protein
LQKRLEREQDKWQKEGERAEKEEKNRLQHQKVQIENKRNANGYLSKYVVWATIL